MMIREIIANRICKGKETLTTINDLHVGHGCPKTLGLQNFGNCISMCSKCYDKQITFKGKFIYANNYEIDNIIRNN